jgi:hypothetical protein
MTVGMVVVHRGIDGAAAGSAQPVRITPTTADMRFTAYYAHNPERIGNYFGNGVFIRNTIAPQIAPTPAASAARELYFGEV